MRSKDFMVRVEKVRELMAEKQMDGLYLFPGVNMYYFSGFHEVPSERLWATVIPAKNDPIMILPRFEKERVESSTWITDVWVWQEGEDPYVTVREALDYLGLDKGTLGLDGKMMFTFFDKLQRTAPNVRFINADPILYEIRITKSKAEIELVKQASRILEEAYRVGFESISPGRTELDLVSVIDLEIRQRGGIMSDEIVLSGPNSALPHGVGGKRNIQKGDVVMFDMYCVYQGYYADITRQAVVGPPTEKQKKMYEIVLEAQKTAIEAIRPGVTAEDVDTAARNKIVEAGYGSRFTHRTGHGLGLEGHEEPYIAQGNKLLLKPGMTFTVEPGIYLAKEFGIRIEDNVVVTESGVEDITVFEKEGLLSA